MNKLIECKNIELKIGSKLILNNINFELSEQDSLGILGESGSGKTSLLKVIMNLFSKGNYNKSQGSSSPVFSGNLRIHCESNYIQMLFQDNYGSLNPRFTVFEILSDPLIVNSTKNAKKDSSLQRQIVSDSLNEVGLDDSVLQKYPSELSGGQRQRIALARVLLMNPKIVLLDEPSASLDEINKKIVINLILQIKEKKKFALITVSHDIDLIKKISNKVLVFKDAQIIESALTSELFSNPISQYTKDLISFYSN